MKNFNNEDNLLHLSVGKYSSINENQERTFKRAMAYYNKLSGAKYSSYINIDKCIRYNIHHHYPTYEKEYGEDMYQEAYKRILENYKNFNPDKGSAVTFFSKHINAAISDYITKNISNTTNYYAHINKKINKAIKEFEIQNLSYTDEDIAKKAEISTKTLKQCRESIIQNFVELDNNNNNENIVDINSNTENIVVNRITSRAIKKSLYKNLNKEERYILFHSLGIEDYEKLSDVKLAKKLGCSDNTVRRRREKILQKLKNLPEFKNYF